MSIFHSNFHSWSEVIIMFSIFRIQQRSRRPETSSSKLSTSVGKQGMPTIETCFNCFGTRSSKRLGILKRRQFHPGILKTTQYATSLTPPPPHLGGWCGSCKMAPVPKGEMFAIWTGLWIRIGFLLIQIQLFFSMRFPMRIRIQLYKTVTLGFCSHF